MVRLALAWLGPVSSARPGGTPFLYILGALVAGSFVWHAFRERARTKQIREFSARKSLTYVGAAVPRSFPLHRAKTFQWGRSIRRAFAGSNGSKDLIVFERTIGSAAGNVPVPLSRRAVKPVDSAGLNLDRILLLKNWASGPSSMAQIGLCRSRRSRLSFQRSMGPRNLPIESV
jgi:hypothetical protein